MAPLYDISMIQTGAVDLLYCLGSFHSKKGRFPADYTELSTFVAGSDGYLGLAKYERVSLLPLENDEPEVRYVRPGRTNEMKFTLGNVYRKN